MGFRSRLARFAPPIFTFLVLHAPALAQDNPRISRYDVASEVELHVRQAGSLATGPGAESVTAFRFRALGREFDISLVPNERLVTNLRAARVLPGDLNVFRGEIAGVPDSWARFSLIDGRMLGAVWDGNELFLVDSAANLRDFISGNLSDEDILVFRASDVYLRVDDDLHYVSPGSTIRGDQVLLETKETMRRQAASAASAAVPSRGIPLGLILDSEFPETDNESHALFPTNIADGIHSGQVDIHLDVEHIHRFDDTNDPFVSNNAAILLNQLPDIKSATPGLAPLGLAHLLTDRDLTGDTRGIAQFNSLCANAAGTGLTEVRGSTLDGLIMAHEIAHNFGAPHDGEAGSACAGTATTYLMAATINGSDEFSPCSLAQMAPVLDAATCLTEVVDGDISLVVEPVPVAPLVQESISYRYFINNLGGETSFNGFLELSADAGLSFENFTVDYRRCGHQPDELSRTCELGSLYGGESDRVSVRIRPTAVGPLALRAVVSSSNDVDPSNNEVILNFDVQAATDLITRTTVHSPNLRPGESTLVTVTVSNDGDFDTDAVMWIRTDSENAISTNDNCAIIEPRWLECELGTVAAGLSTQIEFLLTVSSEPLSPTSRRSQSAFVDVTATLPDPATANNDATPYANVWGSFMDLGVELVSAPVSLTVGESGEVVIRFSNNGPDVAPDARLSLRSTPPRVNSESVSSTNGVCGTLDVGAVCDFTDLQPGESVEVRYRFQTVDVGVYSFAATSAHYDAYDTDANNNGTNFQVMSESPPIPPRKQSTGGGSAIMFIPLLLLHLLARWGGRCIGRYLPRSASQP